VAQVTAFSWLLPCVSCARGEPSRHPSVSSGQSLEAVPFSVVVDRPVSGGVGREATEDEARLYWADSTLKAPLFHGGTRVHDVLQQLKRRLKN
jgi:hypothetical protein